MATWPGQTDGNGSSLSQASINTSAEPCLERAFCVFSPSDSQSDVTTSEQTALWIQQTVCFAVIFIAAAGIPGNVLSAVVFYRQGLGERINLCLFAHAITDLSVDLVYLVRVSDRLKYYLTGAPRSVDLYMHSLSGAVWASQFLSAVIASERCFCVVSPFHAKRLLKTSTMAAIIVVCCFVLITGKVLTVGLKYTSDPATNLPQGVWYFSSYYLDHQVLMDTVDTYVYSVGISGFFLAVVILTTSITIFKLRAALAWRQSATTVTTSANRTTSVEHQGYKTRITLVRGQAHVTMSIPVEHQAYVTMSIPVEDQAHVTMSIPVEDQAHVTMSIPVEDEAHVTRSIPVEDQAHVTMSIPVEDKAHVTRSIPVEDQAHLTKSIPVEDEAHVTRSIPVEDQAHVTTSIPVEDQAHVTMSIPVEDQAHVTRLLPEEDQNHVTMSIPVEDQAHVTRSIPVEDQAHVTMSIPVEDQAHVTMSIPVEDQAHVTMSIPVEDQAYVTMSIPVEDQAHVTMSIPVEDQAHLTRSIPVEDQAHLTKSIPVEDEAHVTRSIPVEDQAHVTTSIPVEDQAHLTMSIPVEDQAHVTRSIPVEDQGDVTRLLPVEDQAHLTRSIPVDDQAHTMRSIPVEDQAHVARSIPVEDRVNMTRSKKEFSVTLMLIVTSILFVVHVMPNLAVQIAISIVPDINFNHKYSLFSTTLWTIVESLWTVNSSVNFIVYFKMGTNFRESLKELMTRRICSQ